MDLEEILMDAKPLIDQHGSKLFDLGKEHAKIVIFQILRDLMEEKDIAGDKIALETLAWAWIETADRYSNL